MFPVLAAVAFAFILLFAARVGGVQRRALANRWPALLLAGAALLALMRGAIWPGVWLGGAAALAWAVLPSLQAPKSQRAHDTEHAADAEACETLGVSPAASEAEIRRAYRAKIAQAHPDRGGGHAEAARLTAARDRLLKKKS